MAVTARPLLATTALEQTWGNEGEEVVFLGEWCKRYERRATWGVRSHRVVGFHWDDRSKLRRDYFYLEALHGRLLRGIADGLNAFHGTDHDIRYWQLLVDPWLLSYLSVAFDRWECVRFALDAHKEIEIVPVDAGAWLDAPFSYQEFLTDALGDEWNQAFYQRILRREYADRVRERAPVPLAPRPASEPAVVRTPSLAGRAVRVIDRIIATLLPSLDVAFVGATFRPKALTRLNLALHQLPRLFMAEFGNEVRERNLGASPRGTPSRAALQVDVTVERPFERFLMEWIVADLPRSVVERYAELRARAQSLRLRAQVIVTASNHWADVFAKFWFAEQVRTGSWLVVAEHGGSLPPFREYFGFEDAIADEKWVWFLAYHERQRQMPPAKIVGRFAPDARGGREVEGGGYCAVIGNECARWVHRAHFYPMANQWSQSFGLSLAFHEQLDAAVASRTRVKPYPSDQGWNTRARYIDALGPEKVLSNRPLDQVFREARIVVCTYPETTFAEAMASGAPTILLYPAQYYELHDVAMPLHAALVEAGIIYTDPAAAAAHVNRVWARPDDWWESESVRQARARFRGEALGFDGDWVDRWTTALHRLMASRSN